jgi:hypothetical protein
VTARPTCACVCARVCVSLVCLIVLSTLQAYNGLTSGSSSTDFLKVSENKAGTKEDLECNGRGACSSATGVCTCDALFETSDGQGNAGYLGDCGYTPNNTVACPVDALDGTCSGHGKCNVVTDQVRWRLRALA